MMRWTLSGSDASSSVSAIGCRCPVCLSSHPRIDERVLPSGFNIKTARFSSIPKEESEAPASRFAGGRG